MDAILERKTEISQIVSRVNIQDQMPFSKSDNIVNAMVFIIKASERAETSRNVS